MRTCLFIAIFSILLNIFFPFRCCFSECKFPRTMEDTIKGTYTFENVDFQDEEYSSQPINPTAL